METLVGLISIPAGVGLALFIFWLTCYFDSDNIEMRKVRKQRREWYKKYPIGTNIEVITYKKKQYNNQFEMETQRPNPANIECAYYTVINPKDYFKSWEGGNIPKALHEKALDNNGALLICRGEKNEFRFFYY